MKPGTTVIKERKDKTFPPIVLVGADDRIVHVDFGTITITLSAANDGSVIIARGNAANEWGDSQPLFMRGATDVQNTVEFTLSKRE